jgi:hypothetical protein
VILLYVLVLHVKLVIQLQVCVNLLFVLQEKHVTQELEFVNVLLEVVLVVLLLMFVWAVYVNLL